MATRTDTDWRRRAERAEVRAAALNRAAAAVAAEHDVDRVLQLIVDEVRQLVDARQAALGITNRSGAIETFITSGISAATRRRIGPLPVGRGLLGALIREGKSIRLASVADDPRSVGVPPHHFAISSFLGVAVPVRGRPMGNLYLTNKVSGEFTSDDQDLVERFALHAGIAIDNARLLDQVQRLAVMEERDRIGRELHDSVIQQLYGVSLSLEDVPELVPEDPEDARRRVDEAIESLHGAIAEMREFVYGLRPALLAPADLRRSLADLAEEAERGRLQQVDTYLAEVALPPDVAAELVAITREALSNVTRHSEATEASVRLMDFGDRVRLRIVDNGRGFDARGRRGAGHHGVANIRDRAAGLGGRATVRSRPGEGTTVTVDIPVDQE
jgi:signal transduction histidine kinase